MHLLASYRAELQLRFVFWTMDPQCKVDRCRLCGLFFWIRKQNIVGEFAIIFYIIWLAPRAGKMNQIARSDWLPERARWSHLARSGPPAASRMKKVLESHIINPLLTKFVRSRWLDIGLVLFLRVYGP